MRKIVLSGGELFNKGAQAMTFICVDEISQRWPEYNVVLLSTQDFNRNPDEKGNFKFDIIPQPKLKDYCILMLLLSCSATAKICQNSKYRTWLDILNETELWLDISGYGLGSYWKPAKSVQYMLNVALAKIKKIPMYLMPQSFGPFNFHGFQGQVANAFIKHYIHSIKLAMARESEGKILLEQKYHLSQVVKTPDMVLQNKGINFSNVFVNVPIKNIYNIKERSVAIIPNIRNNKYGTDKIMNLYKEIIDFLLDNSFNISLIFHAVEDYPVCIDIKKMFYYDSRVNVIDHEISGIEMNDVMKAFAFVIASRFHSIVHSYKAFVPALVLGWATKYIELLEDFNQTRYMFDVRKDIIDSEVLDAISYLIENYQVESESIEKHLYDIQKTNVFDYIRFNS